MNLPSKAFDNIPIVSLQSGEAVAWTRKLVIDQSDLRVVALQCEAPRQKQFAVLRTGDIRQMAADCAIVDSEDELSAPEDLVRLTAVIASKYSPIDKSVVSDLGRKLGHVEEYEISAEHFLIEKLHVRQSIFKAWLGSHLIIDRSQIIDVTPKQFVVRDSSVTADAMQTKPAAEGLP